MEGGNPSLPLDLVSSIKVRLSLLAAQLLNSPEQLSGASLTSELKGIHSQSISTHGVTAKDIHQYLGLIPCTPRYLSETQINTKGFQRSRGGDLLL